MSLPRVVSRDEWLVARKELLAAEKAMTRARDALNAERRMLPMVRIDKEYVFEGPDGKASLSDLFDGRHQLIVQHIMLGPEWNEACPGCSFHADNLGHLAHLHARDTTYAAVSRAPLAELEPFKKRMGWTFPWYSSFGSDFNYDFHVSLDEERVSIEWNYRTKAELQQAGLGFIAEMDELNGVSVFLRDGDNIFHTYSTYGRGLSSCPAHTCGLT